MLSITITAGGVTCAAVLHSTETAQAIAEALPVSGAVRRWGDEIYFEIPVTQELDSYARSDVEVGDLGYWPVGRAFCIFFGPTPMSSGSKPRAASLVNIFGEIQDDPRVFSAVKNGEPITVAAA